jgi:hypothetical protein
MDIKQCDLCSRYTALPMHEAQLAKAILHDPMGRPAERIFTPYPIWLCWKCYAHFQDELNDTKMEELA